MWEKWERSCPLYIYVYLLFLLKGADALDAAATRPLGLFLKNRTKWHQFRKGHSDSSPE